MKKKYLVAGILLGMLLGLLLFALLPALSRSDCVQHLLEDAIRSRYTFDDMVELYHPSAYVLSEYMDDRSFQNCFYLRFHDLSAYQRLQILKLSDSEIFAYLKPRYTSDELLAAFEAAPEKKTLADYLP